MTKQPPEICKEFAGTETISVDRLRRELGLPAFDVWVAFLWRRNKYGESYASARSIARDKVMSIPTVNRACKKLEQVSLLQECGWVAAKAGRRFKRVVFGDFRKNKVSVPRETIDALERLPKWGGKRKGAGRRGVYQDESTMYQDESKLYQDDIILKRSLKRSNIFLKKDMESSDSAVSEIINLYKAPPVLHDDDSVLELPPFPSASLLEAAKVPAPLRLSAELSENAAVEILLLAYRGVVESRYKKKSYAFTRGDITKSKYYRGFTKSVEFLRREEIAPVSWAAFSIDAWLQYMERSTPPTANWVFSLKRLQENQEWFLGELKSYGGGRLLFSTKHVDVLRRYDGLKRAMLQVELNAELMTKWFPGGWQNDYEKAKQANQQDQQQLNRLLERGTFIW